MRAAISDAYPDAAEITMVFGVMRDKAMQEMAEILFPIAGHVILTHANNPRAATPAEIRQAAARVATGMRIEDAESVMGALEAASEADGGRGLVVVTGSIYVVGEAIQILGVRI